MVYLTEEASSWHVAVEGLMPRRTTSTIGRFATANAARRAAINTAARLGCAIIIQARGKAVEWIDAGHVWETEGSRDS